MRTIIAVLLLTAPLFADTSGRPEPPKHPWMGYKPGSFAKYKYVTKFNGNNTEMSYTMTLLEVTKTTYKLEYLTEQNGQVNKYVQDIPATQDQMGAYEKGQSGKESLVVNGRRYNCTWTEYVYRQQANGQYTMKVWTSNYVVGGTVKMEGASQGQGFNMSWTMELVEFQKK